LLPARPGMFRTPPGEPEVQPIPCLSRFHQLLVSGCGIFHTLIMVKPLPACEYGDREPFALFRGTGVRGQSTSGRSIGLTDCAINDWPLLLSVPKIEPQTKATQG